MMGAQGLLLAVLVASGPPCDPPATHPGSVLDWLATAPVRAALERLMERARFGLAPYETAAWVVRGRDGDVALRDWSFSGAVEKATWRGPAPDGALAVVHTHPRAADPRPSAGDVALARRLGLPVYTLTRTGLWAARTDGTVRLKAPAPTACNRLACLP